MTIQKAPGKPMLSFEVFPPKRTMPIDTVYKALDGLKSLKPAFISVTYGAGGSANSAATLDIARYIQEQCGIPGAAHLPGIHLARADAASLLEQLTEAGIQNILALRGDVTPGLPLPGDFPHASDLVAFIRARGNFAIMGACYPEGHSEAASLEEDIEHLRRKVDAGVSHLISQLFFDNRFFLSFRSKAAAAGITVPIEAGIMPVTNARQIERMVTMCGASLPPALARLMARWADDDEALRKAGIEYAIAQVEGLVAEGVDGVHLYTMNNPAVAKAICGAVGSSF